MSLYVHHTYIIDRTQRYVCKNAVQICAHIIHSLVCALNAKTPCPSHCGYSRSLIQTK